MMSQNYLIEDEDNYLSPLQQGKGPVQRKLGNDFPEPTIFGKFPEAKKTRKSSIGVTKKVTKTKETK